LSTLGRKGHTAVGALVVDVEVIALLRRKQDHALPADNLAEHVILLGHAAHTAAAAAAAAAQDPATAS
jgi:hypothetical protein